MDPQRTLRVDAALALALLAYAATLVLDPNMLSHDTALLLDIGERLLRGAMPYVDYVETNPPLAHYLSVVPVLVGKGLGVGTVAGLQATLVGLLAFVAGWVRFRLPPLVGPFQASVVALSVVLFAFFVFDGKNLGQREHMFTLLVLPYVVTRLRRIEEPDARGWAIASGILGALGMCIKPHFVVMMAIFEIPLAITLRRRWLGPEIVACAATGLAYALHFLFLPAPMRHGFFDVWMPLLVDAYHVTGQGEGLVERNTRELVLALGFAAAFGAAFLEGRLRTVAWTLGAGMAAGLFIYVWQDKGWTYQQIPARAFAVLMVGFAAGEALSRFRLGGFVPVAYVGLLLVQVGDKWHGEGLRGPSLATQTMAEYLSPGDRIVTISTNAYQAYPGVVTEGYRNIGTYPIAFPVGLLYPEGRIDGTYRAPQDYSEAERVFVADLFRDLRRKPKIVLIENRASCDHCAKGVGYPSYLEHIGFNKVLRKHYTKGGFANNATIWVRKGVRKKAPQAPVVAIPDTAD